MTSVDALINTLRALPRREGTHYVSGARKQSGWWGAALRVFLWEYAGGRCVVCGEATELHCPSREPHYAQAGHIIPSGTARGDIPEGYYPGNLGNMCLACNTAIANRDCTSDLPRFAHWRGIPTEWPTLKRLESNVGESQKRAGIRRDRGLPF